MMIALFVFVLAACGGSDGTSNDASEASSEAEKSEVVNEDDTVENEASDNANENVQGDVELPNLMPSDVPLPDDTIETIFEDSDIQGDIGVNTQMSLEDLEALYGDYFDSNIFAEDVEKWVEEYDDDKKSIQYSIYNDEVSFETRIAGRDDDEHRAVRLIYFNH